MSELNSHSKVPGDLLIHAESLEYCTASARLENDLGQEVTLDEIVGYPVVNGSGTPGHNLKQVKLAAAGDEGNVIGLLIDGPNGLGDETIPDGQVGEKLYQVLLQGPCIVNRDKIATTDLLDADFDVDAIVTALEARRFEFRKESTMVESKE